MSEQDHTVQAYLHRVRRACPPLAGPAVLYGACGALLGGTADVIGGGAPLLPSGVAFSLLVVFGWRVLPGILLGALFTGVWWANADYDLPVLPWAFWPVLAPLCAGIQAAVAFGVARRMYVGRIAPATTWDAVRFLILCIASGGLCGAAVVFISVAAFTGYPTTLVLMGAATWWLFDLIFAIAVSALTLGFVSTASRPFGPFTLVAALSASGLGGAVIFGWFTRDPLLVQVAPGLTPMQFNTALGFVVAGAGLALSLRSLTRLVTAAGSLIALVGLATLFQYTSGWNLGIDQFLLEHTITVNTTFPGRMAPNTALCFVLYGVALIRTTRVAPGDTAAGTLFSIVASLGFVTLLSYAAGIDSAYAWGHMTPMAVHTAAGFLALGLGGVAREVVQTEGLSRRVSLSPLPTGVALAAAAIWVWQAVHHDEQSKIRKLVLDRAADICRQIDVEITYHNHALGRMASRWSFHGTEGQEEWQADARAHLRDFPTMAALAWADASGVIRWLEPLEGYEEIVGFDLSSHPHGLEVLNRVRETGLQQSTDVIAISMVGQGFIVITPVFHAGALAGFVAGLYRVDRLFEVLSPVAMENYQFRVLEKGRVVVHSGAEDPWPAAGESPGGNGMLTEADMRGGLWRLHLMPRDTWLLEQRSRLPVMILFAGLVLAGAATALLYLLESARAQYDRLRLSEYRLRQILDAAPVGIVISDTAGVIRDVNPAACAQFGYRAEELPGKPVEVLVPRAAREMLREARATYALSPGMTFLGKETVFNGMRKNGQEFPVEVAFAPFGSGEGLQVLAMITDITERDEARRKMEGYTRALELINRDLDDFAYVASHDLRAPLTAIASLVGWLEEDASDQLPEASRGHLALIRNRVTRMGRLLEDLLEYSRAGRTETRLERVDLGELVEQVADLHRGLRPLVLRYGDLPQIETVRTPLQQIFRNLISNSLKHHDSEVCTIEVSVDGFGALYEFRVSDDGPGIPPQFHPKVFKMFQTLRPRDEVEGSGMGLALVRKLVERYGGKVWIAARTGRGTAVHFTWPKTMDGGTENAETP